MCNDELTKLAKEELLSVIGKQGQISKADEITSVIHIATPILRFLEDADLLDSLCNLKEAVGSNNEILVRLAMERFHEVCMQKIKI